MTFKWGFVVLLFTSSIGLLLLLNAFCCLLSLLFSLVCLFVCLFYFLTVQRRNKFAILQNSIFLVDNDDDCIFLFFFFFHRVS